MNEGSNGLELDAARAIVSLCRLMLESIVSIDGVRVVLPPDNGEALARGMADTLPRNESVRSMVAERLWRDRADVFADEELTCGDKNVAIWMYGELGSPDPALFDDADVELRIRTEPVSATLARTLDYIEHIKGLPDFRRFFSLKRHLTAQLRVGQAILGRDF